MRLFVGIAIAEEVKQALERITLRLRAKDDGLRWSAADQWHVTLVFLGEVNDDAYARILRELRSVREGPLTLRMERLGVFERVGILHAEVEVTPELLALYEATAAAVRRAGLEVEERPYRAHVTLARSRNREGRETIERLGRSWAGPSDPARCGPGAQPRLNERWDASEFLLYESKLSPKGSMYVVKERFGLKSNSLSAAAIPPTKPAAHKKPLSH